MHRSNFLKYGLLAGLGAILPPSAYAYTYRPKLSFSTLGCPTWSLEQIIDVAVVNNYRGIELRGIQGQMDLPLAPDFATDEAIFATLKKIEAAGLKVVNLGSSANLHFANPTKKKEQLDHAKRFIDQAHKLACPYIRVFPNELPKEQSQAETIDLIACALQELARYAKPKKVKILLETHGEVVHTELILRIIQKARHSHVGLIWDVWNMWSVTKESPGEVYKSLKKYIKHVHLKDGRLKGDKTEYVLLGAGEAPLAEAIELLKEDRFQGYYSFEWEKAWHPEIADPEVAIPDYPLKMKGYFK